MQACNVPRACAQEWSAEPNASETSGGETSGAGDWPATASCGGPAGGAGGRDPRRGERTDAPGGAWVQMQTHARHEKGASVQRAQTCAGCGPRE
eukprot:14817686-Alexandrium_andersonii.AAC.1